MYDMLLLISSMKQVKDHVPKYILLHGKKKRISQLFIKKIEIFRAPDTATIKRKMLCASSKDALKNALQGIRNHLQATCRSDLDLAAIISEKTKSK
jgi:hypothetical protein